MIDLEIRIRIVDKPEGVPIGVLALSKIANLIRLPEFILKVLVARPGKVVEVAISSQFYNSVNYYELK